MLGCLDLVKGFTDTPLPAAVAALITVVVLVVVAAASTSLSAEDPSPTAAGAAVLAVVDFGAMDGRAAFSDHRRPVSCSFSLRFSLRACDFEYGARDASRPVSVPPRNPFSRSFVRPQYSSDDWTRRVRIEPQ
jgi:hypothetical protein